MSDNAAVSILGPVMSECEPAVRAMKQNYLNECSDANLACVYCLAHVTSHSMLRALPLILVLAACTSLPDLDNDVQQSVLDSDFPDLVPLNTLNLDPGLNTATQAELSEGLLGRISALRARAARLQRTPVIEQRVKRRMARGIKLPKTS